MVAEVEQREEHALVVVFLVGLAHHGIEFREPGSTKRSSSGIVGMGDALLSAEAVKVAEHEAHGVAQLAVNSTLVLKISAPKRLSSVKSDDATQSRRISAPYCLTTSCGEMVLPIDFDIFSALLVEDEAVGHDRVIGRAAAVPQAFQQRGMEPAAMLVRAFEIDRPPASRRSLGGPRARRHGSSRNRTRHRECR